MNNEIDNVPRFCQAIDRFINVVGRVTCWLNIVLIFNILIQVILRYFFGKGEVWLEELQWHFYGVIIMFGISYGIIADAHIRLDLFHAKFSSRRKEAVEFWGMLILLLPFVTILFLHGLDFVETSWRVNEGSDSPLGLPWRWIIKSALPVSMALLWLAGFSRMIRAAVIVFKKA